MIPVGDGVVILKFESALHFANCEQFKDKIMEVVEDSEFHSVIIEKFQLYCDSDNESLQLQEIDDTRRRLIIVDCSAICFIDTMGAEVMCEARKMAAELHTEVVFADIPGKYMGIHHNLHIFFRTSS